MHIYIVLTVFCIYAETMDTQYDMLISTIFHLYNNAHSNPSSRDPSLPTPQNHTYHQPHFNSYHPRHRYHHQNASSVILSFTFLSSLGS